MSNIPKIIFRALADYLFPITCVGCDTKDVYLCSGCQERLVLHETPLAPAVFAAVSYEDPRVRKLLWSLKYKGDHRVAGAAARILWRRMASEFSSGTFRGWEKPIVVAVPSSGANILRDGAHAEEIARSFADFAEFEYLPGIIRKARKTKQQMRLPRQERFKNVFGAFAATTPETLARRNIIVIDDIVTTGATFGECRRALLSAGAKDVVCLAVAH